MQFVLPFTIQIQGKQIKISFGPLQPAAPRPAPERPLARLRRMLEKPGVN